MNLGSSIPRSSGNSIGSAMSRSPGINLGSSGSRSPGINLSRPGTTTLRPNIAPNVSAGNRILNGSAGSNLGAGTGQGQLGSRLGNALNGANRAGMGQGQLGTRLGSALDAAANRGGIGQSQAGSRLGNALGDAASRAGIGGASGTGLGNILSRATGQRASGTNLPGSARTSANDVGRFLSLSGRQPGTNLGGLAGGNARNGLTGLSRGNLASGNLARGAGALNLNAGQANRIRGSMQTAFNRPIAGANLTNRAALSPVRAHHWNNWAGNVRHGWHHNHWFHSCFNNRFWANHFVGFPWARCHYWWGARPWGDWWGCPTWSSYQTWFPSWGWNDPCYYDYGGNVVFSSGYVYVNGQPIAAADDYAASALDLATVPEPVNPDEAAEWLPLGTFAVAMGEDDKDPTRVIQLAVDREGIMSGTMYNKVTEQTYAVQGRVDKQTQRVAFTIGDSKEVVFETGIYNLTQQQTPLLAQGDGRTETYLLLRLDPPNSDGSNPGQPAGDSKTLVP